MLFLMLSGHKQYTLYKAWMLDTKLNDRRLKEPAYFLLFNMMNLYIIF